MAPRAAVLDIESRKTIDVLEGFQGQLSPSMDSQDRWADDLKPSRHSPRSSYLSSKSPKGDHSGRSQRQSDTAVVTNPPSTAGTSPSGSDMWVAEAGKKHSPTYRQYFYREAGPLSPWHEISLYSSTGHLTCVCLTPAGSLGRFQVSPSEQFNPIMERKSGSPGKQGSSKSGSPVGRAPSAAMPFTVSMLPQTMAEGLMSSYWEAPAGPSGSRTPSPRSPSEYVPGEWARGQGLRSDEPQMLLDISPETSRKTTDVYAVKVLGAFALRGSRGNDLLSWRIVAIDAEDPMAAKLHDLHDVAANMPRTLEKVHKWLDQEASACVMFASGDMASLSQPKDAGEAHTIIAEAHASWQIQMAPTLAHLALRRKTAVSMETPRGGAQRKVHPVMQSFEELGVSPPGGRHGSQRRASFEAPAATSGNEEVTGGAHTLARWATSKPSRSQEPSHSPKGRIASPSLRKEPSFAFNAVASHRREQSEESDRNSEAASDVCVWGDTASDLGGHGDAASVCSVSDAASDVSTVGGDVREPDELPMFVAPAGTGSMDADADEDDDDYVPIAAAVDDLYQWSSPRAQGGKQEGANGKATAGTNGPEAPALLTSVPSLDRWRRSLSSPTLASKSLGPAPAEREEKEGKEGRKSSKASGGLRRTPSLPSKTELLFPGEKTQSEKTAVVAPSAVLADLAVPGFSRCRSETDLFAPSAEDKEGEHQRCRSVPISPVDDRPWNGVGTPPRRAPSALKRTTKLSSGVPKPSRRVSFNQMVEVLEFEVGRA